ncbi:Piso0_005866 [Millerozyma farinosa CBS 7064]|uniref:DNA helicase n=1 Tax=Pichia sorbitophila (strain ATCC MYA-4447 / BCRC 22081 / CBS 7064 / NBRC 10061 / NRRL Y-12695) TaxID=559304 RepID=G8Y348_PICSO|nr:Piso0_005866 [Millerozyma farinosa CBS 7064]
MASKVITTYVVDLSPSMAQTRNGRDKSDLDYALIPLYDNLISKTMKGLKTDLVTVIACHSKATKNPFVDSGNFSNVEVILEKKAPDYDDLKLLKKVLVANTSDVKEDEGDIFESMLVGVGLLRETEKYKFKRNIVVITNSGSKIESFQSELAVASKKAINELQIDIHVMNLDLHHSDDSLKLQNEKNWMSTLAGYEKGRLVDVADVVNQMEHYPTMRKIRPIQYFNGPLRFGKVKANKYDSTSPVKDSDGTSLQIGVQVFPGLKVEKSPSLHQYLYDTKNKTLSKIKNRVRYMINKHSDDNADNGDVSDSQGNTMRYVKDQEGAHEESGDDQENEGIAEINKSDIIDGFKYSNYDLVAVDEDLANSAKLKCDEGMDIIGIMKNGNLPYTYLIGETYYVLPSLYESYRNVLMFNAFCQSLIELDSCAIIRYVPKRNEEIQVSTLLPRRIFLDGISVYSFFLCRLPYKEDEKVGRFPSLSSVKATSGRLYTNKSEDESNSQEETGQTDILPDSDMNKLMEEFILAKDLDKHPQGKAVDNLQPQPSFISNPKISSSPSAKEIKFNNDVYEGLHPMSPAINKFNNLLKRAIFKSLEYDDLNEFLDDSNLIQKVLTGKPEDTNFFNLDNVISLNYGTLDSSVLRQINSNSITAAKDLLKKSHTKYISKQKLQVYKKRKVMNNDLNDEFDTRKTKGNYGSEDVNNTKELPNIDDLLS